MCDYSLEHVASRAAEVGDNLVTTSFRNSITRGFADAREPNVAVCLRPGTEIAFENDVECDATIGIFGNRKVGAKVARFRQLNMHRPHEHHDALEFPNGEIVMLSRLCEGQRATVLQLPASGEPVVVAAEPRRSRAFEWID